MVDQRYAKASYQRKGVWRSELLAIVALLVFVAAIVGIDAALRPNLGGFSLLLVGIVLAIVPAFLWLAFFYFQDRLEPEPVGQVARMFVIGLALAGAIGLPVLDQVFQVQEWLYRDTTTTVLGSILIGTIETFLIYSAVRYFIFDSPEFDERTDGVIYGTAAGLGVATASNLQFILGSGGAALGSGEVFVAEVALAQAAFGGLLGYFLGRAKLEQEPPWWLAAGFGLTAVLAGLFTLLRSQVETGSFNTGAASRLPSLTSLLLAGGLAIVVTAIVSALIQRDIRRTQSGTHTTPTGDPTVGDRQANWFVVALFVVLLLIGVVGWNSAVNGTSAFSATSGGATINGSHPSYFAPAVEGETWRASDTLGSGSEFSVRALAVADAKAATSQLAAERGTDASFYRVTENEEVTVAGRPALKQRFAYVDTGALVGATPVVIEGIDYIIVDNGRTIVATMVSDEDNSADIEPLFERFVSSLTF